MKLTTIFYHTDEFCKLFEKKLKGRALTNGKNIRARKISLKLSEVMAIMIYYHDSHYKNFKSYYKYCEEVKQAFPRMPSYNRFVELQQQAMDALLIFAKIQTSKKAEGNFFIDSFPLRVSHVKRITQHKTFKGLAKRGKTSLGWFFGFKLHLVISDRGELVDFDITPGNVADNNVQVIERLTDNIKGTVYGDKGYLLNQDLLKKLYSRGVKMISKAKANMKPKIMDISDRLMLKKRGIVESVGSLLKQNLNIEHSRYRSPLSFLTNVLSALGSYIFRENKPSIYKKGPISLSA
jgi:hypothetical protein